MPCIDLDCLRDSANNILAGTAYILTPTRIPDSLGGGTVTFGTAGTAACLVSDRGRPVEVVVGEQVLSVPGFDVVLPHGTTIACTNRIVSEGWTYEVVGHNLGRTNRIWTKATCYRVGDA